jgi:hypothetical protein
MFNQLKNAVEQLVPPPGATTDSDARRRGSTEMQRSQSMSPLSSGQLAESARTSLRKSLSQQRGQTPERSNGRASPASSATSTTAERPRKTTLEERLRRATAAAIADNAHSAANSPSPSPSAAGSALKVVGKTPSTTPSGRGSRASSLSRTPELKRPQSPASVPLPHSPAVRPSKLADSPPLPELSRLDPGTKSEEKELDATSERVVGEDLSSKDTSEPEEKDIADNSSNPRPGVQVAEEDVGTSPLETKRAPELLPSPDIPADSDQGPPVQDRAPLHNPSPTGAALSSAAPCPEPTETPPVHDSFQDKALSSPPPPSNVASPAETAEVTEVDPVPKSAPQLPAGEKGIDIPAPLNPTQDTPITKAESSANDTLVEELQQRLKQVEQRFTGTLPLEHRHIRLLGAHIAT